MTGNGSSAGVGKSREVQTHPPTHPCESWAAELLWDVETPLTTPASGPNSIRLCPPLVITKEQADFAMDTLEQCLQTLA